MVPVSNRPSAGASLAILLTVLAAASLAFGQAEDRSRNTLERIASLQQEVATIEASLPSATPEEARVLRVETEEKRRQVRRAIGTLMKRAEEDEQLGALVLAALEKNEAALRASIKSLEQRIAALRRDLEESSGTERLRIETELTRENAELDDLLAAQAESLSRRERLGMDVAAAGEALDETLVLRAETIAGLIRVAVVERRQVEDLLASKPEGEKGARLQSELEAWNEKLRGTAESLQTLAGVMERRGLSTAEYRTLLIEATGRITGDILDKEVAMGLGRGWLTRMRDWLIESAPGLFFKTLLFLLILTVFWVLSSIVRRLVRRGVERAEMGSALLRHFLVGLAAKAVLIVGVLVALAQVGVNLGPMLAGLGIAGFIVGFALQDTLSNFASGLMILAYRPFDVGDVIEGGGVKGIVDTMSLVATTIRTFDNEKLIVPNNKIWGDVIRNVTSQTTRRVDMTFGIAYSDDIEHAERVFREILEAHPAVLGDPAPVIKLSKLGESSVDFIVRPWVKTEDYWNLYWDVTRSVKQRFDAEGISIPFPQRDVHLRGGKLTE